MYIYISAPHTFTCLTFTDLLSFDPFFYLFSLSSVPPSVPPPLCAGAPMPCAMYSLLFLKLLAFPPKSLLAHSYSTELLSKAPGSGGWTQNQRHQGRWAMESSLRRGPATIPSRCHHRRHLCLSTEHTTPWCGSSHRASRKLGRFFPTCHIFHWTLWLRWEQ